MSSITLENVSCSFSCFNRISLESLLKRKKNLKEFEKFYALKDINLTIDKGDRIGLIGENGSGKSTFLRLVSGIYKQSSGRIIRNMSVKCLLDKIITRKLSFKKYSNNDANRNSIKIIEHINSYNSLYA